MSQPGTLRSVTLRLDVSMKVSPDDPAATSVPPRRSAPPEPIGAAPAPGCVEVCGAGDRGRAVLARAGDGDRAGGRVDSEELLAIGAHRQSPLRLDRVAGEARA